MSATPTSSARRASVPDHTQAADPTTTAVFYPISETIRARILVEAAILFVFLVLGYFAAWLTQNEILWKFGLATLIVIGMVALGRVRIFLRCGDPAWLAARAPRITLTPTELQIAEPDKAPVTLPWTNIKRLSVARRILDFELRAGRNVQVGHDLFSFGERMTLEKALEARIAAAPAPKTEPDANPPAAGSPPA